MPPSSPGTESRTSGTSRFIPEFSTENDYARAWRSAGHTLDQFQEGDVEEHVRLMRNITDYDFVVWTRTRDLALQAGELLQWQMIAHARRHKVPIVGVHLDIWIGLDREKQVETDPYFQIDLLLTADGGNQEAWARYGVNHHWLLPGISEDNVGLGTPREKYRSEIAFVGSWQGGYHREAKHRHELVNWLDRTYGDRVQFWPKRGEHAIRGRELNDLYASVDVVVGDSAVLPGKSHYCSDRIPETAGRGGILLHPLVDGINVSRDDWFTYCHFSWRQGNWKELRHSIDAMLGWSETEREERRRAVCDMVAMSHTYTHRCAEIILIMNVKGLL